MINDRTNLNTDGIDPDMSTDVTIDRSFVYTKDDAICVKATRNSDLCGNVERVMVTNNLVSSRGCRAEGRHGVGSGVTSPTSSSRTTHVFDSGRAMSVVVRDGATYDHVTFREIRVGRNVDHLVEQVIGVRDPAAALGVIRDLTFDDVTRARRS